ncbi:MAG: AraC family transcriptional regulator [Pseudomonadota bacterium]
MIHPDEASHKTSKLWRIPEMGNIELVRATYSAHMFPRHYHEEYVIGVITDGIKTMDYRGGNHVLPRGTVCVVHPGEIHTSKAFDDYGWMYRMFYVTEELMAQTAAQISGRGCVTPFFSTPVIRDDDLFRRMNKLHCLLEDTPTASIDNESYLLNMLASLIVRHADCKPSGANMRIYSKQIKTVKQYINQHIGEDLKLKTLADMACISPYYFIRLFKREVGVTPHIYITHKRIKLAKQLLAEGRSIAEVAMQTGFVDQNHMTNRFKTIVGFTPGQFKTNCLIMPV